MFPVYLIQDYSMATKYFIFFFMAKNCLIVDCCKDYLYIYIIRNKTIISTT